MERVVSLALEREKRVGGKIIAAAVVYNESGIQMAQTVHVYRSDAGWAVKREGRKSSDLFATQKAAIERARSIARDSAPSQLIVHGKDGLIRDYVTHGLPKVQDPPGKRGAKKSIQKAVGRVVLERFALDPHPPRA